MVPELDPSREILIGGRGGLNLPHLLFGFVYRFCYI